MRISSLKLFLLGIILLTWAGILAASPASAASPAALEVGRTAVVSGVITGGGNLDDVSKALSDWSMDGSGKPISLVVDSPGGSVTAGFWFVNQMEAARVRGVKLNCYVPNLAASMAFQILMHCDARYVTDKSLLLWHPVRVSVGGMFGEPMTAQGALDLFNSLHPVDQVIYKETSKLLLRDKPDSYIRYHFEHETLHVGSNLAKSCPHVFQSYPAIPGLFEALKNETLPRSRKQAGLFGLHTGGDGDIQYIAPDYIRELIPSIAE